MFKKFAIAASAMMLAVSASAWEAKKPVTIVIPYGSGGVADIIGRIMQPRLEENLKQSVVIESRVGGSGKIGTQYVAKQPADGYTLIVTTPSNFGTNQVFLKDPGYDIAKDFDNVITIGMVPKTLVAVNKGPFKDVKDIVAQAKAAPGTIKYGSIFNTSDHLYSASFVYNAGVKMTHITYKKSSQLLPDLMNGTIPLAFDNLPLWVPHIEAGTLKLLAVSWPTRLKAYPDVPTWGELGFKDISRPTWYGFAVPKGTPKEAIERLNKAVKFALQDKEIVARLEKAGVQIVAGSPAEADKLVNETLDAMKRIAQQSKIEASN